VLQLQTASTTALTIDTSANVGIGTTSPAAKTEISGTAAAQNLALRITNTATDGYSTLQLGGGGDGGVFRNGSAQSGYAGASSLNLITVGSHAIGLATGNTIRAIIPGAGGVQAVTCVSVGNATPAASGAGITFPATQSASSDANTLDDYEEGNWTPTVTAVGSNPTVVYSANVGTYTKIGRMVMIQCYVETTSRTGGSGEVRISGLPFTAANQSQSYAGVSASQAGGLTGSTSIGVRSNANATNMTLYKNGGNTALDVSEWGNSALFLVALSYIV
jgi:hypothetical protein